MKKSRKNLSLVLIVMAMCHFTAIAAWATVSFVKPEDAATEISKSQKSDIPSVLPIESRSRAPEPATLALFGSGFFGMALTFIRRTYVLAKRTFDLIAAVIIAIVAAPLMLLIALLVKLTSQGPMIYSQTRVGKDGEEFEMYKFRTMRVDAEKDTGPVWAATNDSRLTPIGGLLRKTHFDELPQLINVLRGEMSIIGPRPERPLFVNKFKEIIPDYEKRLLVKPGITGLAQVWHRYDETIDDVKKKLKYDLLYIKKLCFWSDFQIMLRTVRVVVTGEGAK